MTTLSVIIPVYYNEESLSPLYEKLVEVEQKLLDMDVSLELIFVDDGSRDGSLRELMKIKEARPATKVIKLAKNFGSVHASKTGFRFVSGDAFTILAADLQDPPELLLRMTEIWKSGAKYIICAREKREDPLLTRVFAFFYYRLVQMMLAPDYPHGGYDVALMDKVMLPYMIDSSKTLNTPLYAYWLGFTPVRISYHRQERLYGKSRWTFSKRIQFFLDGILSFSVVPIRIISFVGISVSILSFLFGLNIVIQRLLGNMDPEVPGYAALAALLTFFFGLVLVMLGIIGEYVWRIFEEVNKRPESVIEEIY
jgi:dolichol-phosphate mannosyltransferase